MHVEFLSHWSGNLGREMNLNRYGHVGFLLSYLLHQVVLTMNMLILV